MKYLLEPALSVNPIHSDSITELYQDHHGWLHGWLRKKLGCSHQAADLAHDTFMRLLTLAAELNISITTVKRYLIKAGAQCYFALVID